jgi:hypothetical protein
MAKDGAQQRLPSRPRRQLVVAIGAFCAMPAVAIAQAAKNAPKAAAPAPGNAERAALEKRVLAYWAARKGSDLGAAYAFYSPEFRAAHPRPDFLRDYQRLIRFPPEKFSVESVEFVQGGAEANVKVKLELNRNIEGHNVALAGISEEVWVRVDRTWWKKDEPLKFNV